MSHISRVLAGLSGALSVLVLGGISPAYADATLRQCMNEGIHHNGELPTCTRVNGTWVPSWSGGPGSSGEGIPGFFVFFIVMAILLGVGVTIRKVSTAQKLAKQSGMDPSLATQMTLLSDDGLDATYLAASLRRPPVVPVAPAPESPSTATQGRPQSSTAERLTELTSLLDRGLVTRDEYDARRQAIIDSV